jgi:tRNA-2-methylthio-N6-dimethylallyladenosine synthase
LNDLQTKGYKEITLLGQNVNSYRFDNIEQSIDFAALLDLVASAAPDMRIRFATSHPKDMSDEIIQTIARHRNICRHIHLPAQSGSSRILKLMNRGYTRQWYLDRIASIRRILPDCSISTDLFVGFHSETDDDHQQTLALMQEVKFDAAFMFKYSERPGTYAAKKLADNVPEETKVRRLQEIIDLQNHLSTESNCNTIGRIFEVLVEGYSKRSKERMFGRTSQNKIVVFDKTGCRTGEYIMVKITNASSATLQGERI